MKNENFIYDIEKQIKKILLNIIYKYPHYSFSERKLLLNINNKTDMFEIYTKKKLLDEMIEEDEDNISSINEIIHENIKDLPLSSFPINLLFDFELYTGDKKYKIEIEKTKVYFSGIELFFKESKKNDKNNLNILNDYINSFNKIDDFIRSDVNKEDYFYNIKKWFITAHASRKDFIYEGQATDVFGFVYGTNKKEALLKALIKELGINKFNETMDSGNFGNKTVDSEKFDNGYEYLEKFCLSEKSNQSLKEEFENLFSNSNEPNLKM